MASGADLAQVFAKARRLQKGNRRILISRVLAKEVLNP